MPTTTPVNMQKEAQKQLLDFSNTENAFCHKNDQELKKSAWLFRMMNHPWLVKVGSALGLKAVEWNLPFARRIVKATIFEQFCGGSTLLDCLPAVQKLKSFNTFTVLDYGAEGKESETDFNHTMNEAIRALEFAAHEKSVAIATLKVSGMGRMELLEKVNTQAPLTADEQEEYHHIVKRLDAVCYAAAERGVGVYIDAEESWIQNAIDALADKMMARYNKKQIVVFNTFQMYRHDRLDFLKKSYIKCRQENYLLGAKLVRGAYMLKEKKRADELDLPSPINPSKAATDQHYDDAVRFCVENLEYISFCNASHNAQSALLQTQLLAQKGIAADHPHLMFSQLYGMSDNLTFNLAAAGYRVGKYMPYGTVQEVIPYLIRRAQENTSVTGDMSREYQLLEKEMKRRKL